MGFSKPNENRIIINLGGIANITILHSESGMLGFDTGPGNCLMDEWYEKIQHRKFDYGGSSPRLVKSIMKFYLAC